MSATSSIVKRDIVTPVTTILFVVSTVTGIMLLLHWQGSLVHVSHEWLSLAFSAVAGWHLVKNWRAFARYLERRVALSAIAAALAISVVFTGLTGSPSTAGGGGPRAVIGALAEASLATAAPALGLEPAAAIDQLTRTGFTPPLLEDTLAAIAARNGRSVMDVLGAMATPAL